MVKFLSDIKAKDKTILEIIKDALLDLLKNWGEILGVYEGRELETEEARAQGRSFRGCLRRLLPRRMRASHRTKRQKQKNAEGGVRLQARKITYSYENLTSDAFYKKWSCKYA